MVKTRSKTRKKTKKYQIELTPVSALLWGVFSFFLLIWIFVLGILVGRGFLPESVTTISELKEQIKGLQEMVSSRETYDSPTSVETDNDLELAFYERLESKKLEVKNNYEPDEKTKIPVQETRVPEEGEIIDTTSDEKKVIDLEKELVEPSIPSSQNQYTIQVASIGDIDKAEKLVSELKDKGYDAYYYSVQVKDKTYYRIRCGRFGSRGEAQEYALKLEREMGLEGLVSKIE